MATRTITTYDDDGTVMETATVEVSPQETNRDTLQERARTALAANATYLAIATPTQLQTIAQVRLLTREATAVIRLLLGLLDDVG